MERNEYLEMCQKCAVLEKRPGGVINNIPVELIVCYNGISYYPYKYELSFDMKGNARHTAILHDIYTNSVIHADLGRVEK